MSRYQPYSRREFRRRRTSWLGRNKRVAITLTLGLILLLAVETFLLLVVMNPTPLTWWVLGVMQTTLIGAYVFLLHAAFLANDGQAIWHLRGAWGEDNTRSELVRAKHKGLIWGWVDSINLHSGDIDHLVVTRRGGLVAIDSKWRNNIGDVHDMARSGQRVKVRAEALARSLLTREYQARHRARSDSLTVTPIVVLWGAVQDTVPVDARVSGIEFIPGRRLLHWLGDLDGEPVSKAASRDLIMRLERFRAQTWDPPNHRDKPARTQGESVEVSSRTRER